MVVRRSVQDNGIRSLLYFVTKSHFYAMVREDVPVNKTRSWKSVPKIGLRNFPTFFFFLTLPGLLVLLRTFYLALILTSILFNVSERSSLKYISGGSFPCDIIRFCSSQKSGYTLPN